MVASPVTKRVFNDKPTILPPHDVKIREMAGSPKGHSFLGVGMENGCYRRVHTISRPLVRACRHRSGRNRRPRSGPGQSQSSAGRGLLWIQRLDNLDACPGILCSGIAIGERGLSESEWRRVRTCMPTSRLLNQYINESAHAWLSLVSQHYTQSNPVRPTCLRPSRNLKSFLASARLRRPMIFLA